MSSFCERRKRELPLFMIIVPIIRNSDDLQDIGLYFQRYNIELNGTLFSPSLEKKINSEKISYISRNGTFQPHIFLIFQERIFQALQIKKTLSEQSSYVFPEKPFLVFQETELSITKNKEFQKRTFVAQKGKNHYEKNVSYFEKRNFLALSLKKFLIFWEETLKSKA